MWKVLDERPLFEVKGRLTVTEQRLELPDGRVIDDYLQFRQPDYAVIAATTVDGELLVFREYKHGVGRVALTIPGGHVDPGERPIDAAQRELLEETGYVGELSPLGAFVVNANQGGATAHCFAARDCRPRQAPNSGDLEDMTLVKMPLGQARQALADGEFPILGHAAALAMAFLR